MRVSGEEWLRFEHKLNIGLSPKTKPKVKSSKNQLSPNILKLILKKVANGILNSMGVVLSPNSTECKK